MSDSHIVIAVQPETHVKRPHALLTVEFQGIT